MTQMWGTPVQKAAGLAINVAPSPQYLARRQRRATLAPPRPAVPALQRRLPIRPPVSPSPLFLLGWRWRMRQLKALPQPARRIAVGHLLRLIDPATLNNAGAIRMLAAELRLLPQVVQDELAKPGAAWHMKDFLRRLAGSGWI